MLLFNSPKTTDFAIANLPIGDIANSSHVKYGHKGNGHYYVCFDDVFETYLTAMKLSFDEAKAMYNALIWRGEDYERSLYFTDIQPSGVSKQVRKARKLKLKGDNLMFFFLEYFDTLVK